MIDIDKQVTYWRDGALSDWEAAQVLLRRKLVWQWKVAILMLCFLPQDIGEPVKLCCGQKRYSNG